MRSRTATGPDRDTESRSGRGPEAGGGGRLPAEWEPHRATWLVWPHNPDTWPGLLPRIPRFYRALIRVLCRFEETRVLVRNEAEREAVRRAGEGTGPFPLEVLAVPTNDVWVRDFGPLYVRRPGGRVAATLWRFNAWGGKYSPWDLDAAAGEAMARHSGTEPVRADMVLEGGSIDANGRGALLTTESCLLNPNRNPGLDRRAIEARLEALLGVTRVLWLGRGIAGDDTDGHVDDVARFVGPRTVVAAVEDDPRDENYAPLQENLERLQGLRDQEGRALEVIPLPMPEPVYHQGRRTPASYANFYIAGGAVLVPTFGSARDARALGVLGELFPGREVVGIDSKDMVWGLGAVHCATLQEPLAKGSASEEGAPRAGAG